MSTVGQILAEERRRQGRTLAEVEQETRIRGRLLEALEKDEYAILPSPAYVKGYIQSYATFLDIPAGPLVAQYAREATVAPPEGHRYITMPTQQVRTRNKRHRGPVISMRIWVSIAVLLALIAVIMIVVQALRSNLAAEPIPLPPAVTTTTTAAPSTKTDASDSPSAGSAAATTRETPAAKPFTLTVKVSAGSMSWLRVTVDGLKAYEGTLDGGSTKTWQVGRNAEVRIGKPDAVTVLRDGAPAQATDVNGTAVVKLSASAP